MMKNKMIYLDYNATAPIRPEVIDTMVEVMKEGGNPSSVHAKGRVAKARIEKARSEIMTAIHCRSQMVIFTSGGTEANNMAVLNSGKTRLITTNVEHDSINSSKNRFDGTVDLLSIDQKGLINFDELKELLKVDGENTIVSILYANNETGVLQDLEQIVSVVHGAGALIHIDAIQALGKVEIDFMGTKIDMMSISSHKIGGPQGVGALIANEKIPVSSAILGGGQEVGRRGGTENVAGIAGFGKAITMISSLSKKMAELKVWRDGMEMALLSHTDQVQFFGQDSNRLPNVSTIYMPDVLSETQVMNFDLAKICISSGSACSSGKVKASHVIQAMTGDRNIASSTIRMSMGWDTEKTDVDKFVETWIKHYDRKHA